MLSNEVLFFGGFAIFVLLVMLIDLGAFSSKKTHNVSFKEAGFWSAIWVLLAIAFYFFIQRFGYLMHDISNMSHLESIKNTYYKHLKIIPDNFPKSLHIFQNNMAIEYLTGYFVEYSLSVDNIFVFILIFNSFGVDEKHYKKVLVWGILGSIILRFIFIFVGSALLQEFEWIMYIFGAFLVYTGVKIFLNGGNDDEEKQIDTSNHPVVKFVSKYFSLYKRNIADRFFVYNKRYKKWYITPLFVVMIIVAVTDVIFAVDSIPAIFSVTKDPYIVFFSNVFAIMGLRSMFFFLASIMGLFRFLEYGLGVILTFIGGLMLVPHKYLEMIGFQNYYSLLIILCILGLSIGASLLFPAKKNTEQA